MHYGVKVGGKYYFVIHAYHHVIAEVVEILGHKKAWVKNVRWIYSSELPWTEFFKHGIRNKHESRYHIFPDGEISWEAAFEWNHDIPTE